MEWQILGCPGIEHSKFYKMEIINRNDRLFKTLLLVSILIMAVIALMKGRDEKYSQSMDFLVFPLVQKSLGIKIPVTDILK